MKFSAKRFFGIAIATILVFFAHSDHVFAKSFSKKHLTSGQPTLTAWNVHHGEIERVEGSGGQIQMTNHRQPKPTHSLRHALSAYVGYSRIPLPCKSIDPVFVAAGYNRMLRLLLYPHHTFV